MEEQPQLFLPFCSDSVMYRSILYKVEFTKAAHTEKDGLMSRGTYSICDYPDEKWLNKKGKRVIPLKWVFSYRFDEDGYLVPP